MGGEAALSTEAWDHVTPLWDRVTPLPWQAWALWSLTPSLLL